jgi:predicted nucleic acid-binding Zn ribbon protein
VTGLQPIRGPLGEALQGLGLGEPGRAIRLAEEWEEICGKEWGAHSRPVSLWNGELVVEADSGGVAGLLRYATGELLRKIDDRLGTGLVTTVRIRVARHHERESPAGESDRQG